MAVIHLEFDVDGDVYPELYASLVAVAGSGARGERVRQLAATGLIWEAVRIHGFPARDVQAEIDEAPVEALEVGRRQPPAEAAAAPAPVAAEFINLAIDAEPAPGPLPPVEISQHDLELAVRHLPVLRDVVEPGPGPMGSMLPLAPLTSSAPPLPPRPRVSLASPLPAAPAQADGTEAAGEPSDAAPAEEAAEAQEPRPAARSRLMRMRDKGLFKNG